MSNDRFSEHSWVAPDDEANRAMTALVHPPKWPQVAAERYDLVAIGGGTGGLVSSGGAAFLGAKTALIEKSMMGGDCLVTGCVPSKALLHAGRVAHDARHADQWGIEVPEVKVDFSRVMKRLREVRAQISHDDSAESFRERGVDVLFGEARFTSPRTLEVNGKEIRFKRAVISSGGRPRRPSFEGAEHVRVSDDLFEMTELPERVLIIGGGPIGCELAQALTRLGAKVEIVEMGPRLLAADDPEAAAIVATQLEREGIRLRFNSKVNAIQKVTGGYRCVCERGEGEAPSEADLVVAAIGRIPNVEGLGLEKAGVEFSRRGITVNKLMRTSNRRVYATGDCASAAKFTHAAYAQSEYAVLNALFPVRMNARDRPMPWATYTDPEVAHIGPRWSELSKIKGLRHYTVQLDHNDRARLDGEQAGFARVHCRANGRIVAATLVCRGAGELISEISLAMTTKCGLKGIGDTIHPYPTRSDYVRKLADAYNFERVSDSTRGWLRRWFSLLR